jgi:CRISPR/Cas system-associated exonuclease Cas4 (RecB family)
MTKLISGEAACLWSLWFRARNKSDRLESGADLNAWASQHDALVKWRAEKLREQSRDPWLERSIQLQGKLATISGKPDISYEFDGTCYFEDCKTGKRRDADHVQVLLYMWLHSLRIKKPVRGSVVYKKEIVEVDFTRLDEVGRRTIELVKMVANDEPPTSPSPNECRSCSIPKFYCADRQHSPSGEVFITDEF